MNYDSVILGFLYTLLIKFKGYYYDSMIARTLARIGGWGKRAFSSSALWSFVKREDFLSRIWEQSGIYKVLDFLLNLPARLCIKIHSAHEESFQSSIAVKFMGLLAERLEVFIGLFILMAAAIPHNYWNNTYAAAGVLLLLALFFMGTVIQKSGKLDLKTVDVVLFLFILAVLLSAVTSITPMASLRYFLFYATGFLLLLLIVSAVRTGEGLGRLLDTALLGVTFSGLYGIWQFINGVAVDPALTDVNLNEGMPGRVFSTMGNPNNYAEILILTLPFFMAVIFNSKSILKKLLYVFLMLPPLAAMFLTGSRSGWLALAGAAMVYTFLKNRKLIPVILLLGLVSMPLLPDFVMRRIQTIGNPNDSSARYRTLIFETVKPIIRDYWATGIGLGSDAFMRVLQDYHLRTLAMVAHAHNTYIQILLETGVAGAATFIWAMVRTVKKCFINIFKQKDVYINNILIAGVSSLAGIAVMGLVEHVWFYPRVMLFFWLVLGILLAGIGIMAKKTGPEGT